jgi:hypothetical protein
MFTYLAFPLSLVSESKTLSPAATAIAVPLAEAKITLSEPK